MFNHIIFQILLSFTSPIDNTQCKCPNAAQDSNLMGQRLNINEVSAKNSLQHILQ